eukprot:COSAG02_NODE_1515_length_12187_cov_37.042025_3_plen_103_part_00
MLQSVGVDTLADARVGDPNSVTSQVLEYVDSHDLASTLVSTEREYNQVCAMVAYAISLVYFGDSFNIIEGAQSESESESESESGSGSDSDSGSQSDFMNWSA